MAKPKGNADKSAENSTSNDAAATLPPGDENSLVDNGTAPTPPADGGENPAATDGTENPPENPPVPPPSETPPQDGLSASGTVRARVICAGAFGTVDEIVEVSAEVAAQTDELDADPAAVAYAENLQHGLA
ncbi:hypothetical protein [Eikenella sp. NML99-0057]|uniref:hypothetical protein n=1 Tax=Eikenella sp. NML99-0057 TaxID=1795834 RepID=UPI000ADDE308|nr:hypothetical protein [Eikenella sp. NML99-0057]